MGLKEGPREVPIMQDKSLGGLDSLITLKHRELRGAAWLGGKRAEERETLP